MLCRPVHVLHLERYTRTLYTWRFRIKYSLLYVTVIKRLRVQFGINLNERLFQKAEIARAEKLTINSISNEKSRMITYY